MEYYITETEDILLGLGLPPTSGVTGYTANIGTTENKGFELSLNGTIIDNKNGWTWEAGFNFYTNKNKLTSLASGQTRDEGNMWFVGHNINAIFDYKRIGLWETNKDSADAYMDILEPGGKVGMIRVAIYRWLQCEWYTCQSHRACRQANHGCGSRLPGWL